MWSWCNKPHFPPRLKPAVAATATQTLPFLVPRMQPNISQCHQVLTAWQTNKCTLLNALHKAPFLPRTCHQFFVAAIDLLCWRCRRSTRIRILPFQGVHHQRTLKCVKMSSIPPFVPVSDRFMLGVCVPNSILIN